MKESKSLVYLHAGPRPNLWRRRASCPLTDWRPWTELLFRDTVSNPHSYDEVSVCECVWDRMKCLLIVLMLLGGSELPSSRRRAAVVDAIPLRTTCFGGYFNMLRCAPLISWFATFLIPTCDLKCKATGNHQKGTCVRRRLSCLTGYRMLYVCECT